MFRKNHFGYLLLICAVVVCPYIAKGQSSEVNQVSARHYWGVETGLGPSTIGGPDGSFAVRYQPKNIVYSLQISVLDDLEFFSEGSTSLLDIHIMAGLEGPLQQGGKVFGIISAGLGGIYKEECTADCGLFEGPSRYDEKFGPGIPLEAGLNWKPVRFFGVGISGRTSLNFLKPYASANLSLRFGKLR